MAGKKSPNPAYSREDARKRLAKARAARKTYGDWPVGEFVLRVHEVKMGRLAGKVFAVAVAEFIDYDTGETLDTNGKTEFAVPSRLVDVLTGPGDYAYASEGTLTLENGRTMFDCDAAPLGD